MDTHEMTQTLSSNENYALFVKVAHLVANSMFIIGTLLFLNGMLTFVDVNMRLNAILFVSALAYGVVIHFSLDTVETKKEFFIHLLGTTAILVFGGSLNFQIMM